MKLYQEYIYSIYIQCLAMYLLFALVVTPLQTLIPQIYMLSKDLLKDLWMLSHLKIIYRGIRVKEEVNISYQPSWMRINGLQDLPNSCGNGGNVSTSDTMGSVTISIGSCSASVTTYCSVVVGAITVVSLSRV